MNKHYCFTDIHGNYDLWCQIKNYCDETDKLIFLGDAIDRGDAGLQIVQEMLKDKRITYLKGNHEEFLTDIGAELVDGIHMSLPYWLQNGGNETVEQFSRLSYDSQVYYIRKLRDLPLKFKYVNTKGQTILLSHAGFTPGMACSASDLIWDRNHIYHNWPTAAEYENTYVVHGHTPTPIIFQSEDIVNYCDGHKFDLDVGSFVTNKIVLFDLDTLEVAKVFYDKTKEVK